MDEDYGRIGDDLHGDRKPLPLLSGEAVHSRETHKRVPQLVHLDQLITSSANIFCISGSTLEEKRNHAE